MEYRKKLIEVALPLEAINAESAREKSIRHGHPSTLHLWWARRPLAAARAVIFSSLIDDPDQEGVPQALLELIDTLPIEDKYKPGDNAAIGEIRRNKLFGFIEKLVKWENSNDPGIITMAQRLIHAATNGNPPPLLDPFAGGGAIPLEAQRLGLEAHASDLNPVAVMINKAMIEIPPKFAGQPPVNPEARGRTDYTGEWKGAQGLAEDVRYYGEWMKQKAFERIGHLYPKVKDEHGHEHTVIAWIWARTVKCPNPACGCEMPLASSFELSKKKGKEAYIQPVIEEREKRKEKREEGVSGKSVPQIRYEVKYGKDAPEPPKTGRGQFKCICCGEPVQGEYIKAEGKAKGIGLRLMAIVAEANSSRIYLTPNAEQIKASLCKIPEWIPDGELVGKSADQLPLYGYCNYSDLFTNRQLNALTTFGNLVTDALLQIVNDGGSKEYAQAVGMYLSFAVDRIAMTGNNIVRWNSTGEKAQHCFGRQALAMLWDFAEPNIFGNSTGSWDSAVFYSYDPVKWLPSLHKGCVQQQDAQVDNGFRNIMVSTDPPYYDNICYADLSDFFYVWLRQSLKNSYPELTKTMLVPKEEELIASPYRFRGNFNKARNFFENGMLHSFKQINTYTQYDVPVTVYYAFKQNENVNNEKASSTGWETMLFAIIQAGFSIVGTWPMRTEMKTRQIAMDTNALASSIVLVCRKRPQDAPVCTRRDFINTLKRELKPALQKLQASNIAPVDLAQSAIGPGIGVYSRFSKVLEADGTPMSVRSALQIINQELDLYFTEQDGELDRDSRFCVDLFSQYAFNEIKFGEADVLARAKNTSVEKLGLRGILYAQKGVVRLLSREEIPSKVERNEEIIWLLTQQLTRAMDKDGIVGTAKIVAGMFGSNADFAKSLAYRLFTIADRKGWAQEAYAYNSLVIAWPEVQSKAAELQAQMRKGEQGTLGFEG